MKTVRSESDVLWSLRVLWITQALVLAFLFSLITLFFRPVAPAIGYPFPLFGILGVVCLCIAFLFLLFVRSQIYKANWHEDRVSPIGYGKANYTLILYAGISAMFMAVENTLSGISWFWSVLLGICLIVFFANYPNGKPMKPIAPRLGETYP